MGRGVRDTGLLAASLRRDTAQTGEDKTGCTLAFLHTFLQKANCERCQGRTNFEVHAYQEEMERPEFTRPGINQGRVPGGACISCTVKQKMLCGLGGVSEAPPAALSCTSVCSGGVDEPQVVWGTPLMYFPICTLSCTFIFTASTLASCLVGGRGGGHGLCSDAAGDCHVMVRSPTQNIHPHALVLPALWPHPLCRCTHLKGGGVFSRSPCCFCCAASVFSSCFFLCLFAPALAPRCCHAVSCFRGRAPGRFAASGGC